MYRYIFTIVTLLVFSAFTWAEADFGIPAVTYQPQPDGSGRYTVTIQIRY